MARLQGIQGDSLATPGVVPFTSKNVPIGRREQALWIASRGGEGLVAPGTAYHMILSSREGDTVDCSIHAGPVFCIDENAVGRNIAVARHCRGQARPID